MSVPHGSRVAGFLLLAILLPFGVVSVKPAWTQAMCRWNSPSEECKGWWNPLLPKSKCGKSSIETEAQCTAQTDSAGRACFWHAEDTSCLEMICPSFSSETLCATKTASPFNCQWKDYECVASNSKCANTGSYSSEATCAADAVGVGPCLWKSAYDTKCQQVSCADSKDQTSCTAATSKVPAMTFILGSAPYGKTPCHWEGEVKVGGATWFAQCSQIYHCANYKSRATCSADNAGFGSCLWEPIGAKCADMSSCSSYAYQISCVADSFKAAVRKHPQAQCWWEAGPSALVVGSAITGTSVIGPVATSGNFEINADRTLKVIDGKGVYLDIHLGYSLTSRMVMQVKNTAGEVQAWTAIPKPVPDGYTLQLNGACDDNVPKLSDYTSHYCTPISNQEACNSHLAPSTTASTSSGSTTSSASTSSGSTTGATSSGSTPGITASSTQSLTSKAFTLMLCLAVSSAH